MPKKVLVAVDLGSVSDASVFYGIQLAARTESSLALLAVLSSEHSSNRRPSRAMPDNLPNTHREWLDRIVAQARQKAVSLEIFLTSGRFFEEIMHFVRFAARFQFIIVAAPKEKGWNVPASPLQRLHEQFEGEILLVEEAGRITRVSDRYLEM